MKHVFYVSQNAADSLGLERVLNFYNVVALEKTDAAEDVANDAVNIITTNDFTSKEFTDFINTFSYGENPIFLSSSEQATVKLAQVHDEWTILGKRSDDQSELSTSNTFLRFNVYKKGTNVVFGNIHRVIHREMKQYDVQVLDWTKDFVKQVETLVKSLEIADGCTTYECEIGEELKILNQFPQNLPEGIDSYTQMQILQDESPMVLYELMDNVMIEEPLNFHENHKISEPVSQTKAIDMSQVFIRSKYESVIKNDMPSGVWKYGGDSTGKFEKICIARYSIDEEGDKSLCLLHRGYGMYDIHDQEGFVINTRNKDTQLSSGDILAKLHIPFTAVDTDENLFGWVNETITAILNYQMK